MKRPRPGLSLFLTLVMIFSIFPFLWMVISSIKESNEIMSVPPTFLPHSLTGSHYTDVVTETFIPRYFINSSIVATGSTLIALVFAVLGGYGFARYKFRGKVLLQNAVLSSQMLPTAAVIVPLFIILRSMRLLNTHLGLILAYLIVTLPLSVWMITGYFRSIPVDIEEAAIIDGCSRMGVLLRVILPVSVPGILATAVYCFVVTWNEFIFALSFATQRSVMTLPIGLAEFTKEFVTDWGGLMAASVLMTLPIAIVFLAIQRSFISGLTAGAVKG